MTRQQRQPDREAGVGEVLRPGPQRGRLAGEAVAEHDADRAAVGGERLGVAGDAEGGITEPDGTPTIMPRRAGRRHRGVAGQ